MIGNVISSQNGKQQKSTVNFFQKKPYWSKKKKIIIALLNNFIAICPLLSNFFVFSSPNFIFSILRQKKYLWIQHQWSRSRWIWCLDRRLFVSITLLKLVTQILFDLPKPSRLSQRMAKKSDSIFIQWKLIPFSSNIKSTTFSVNKTLLR